MTDIADAVAMHRAAKAEQIQPEKCQRCHVQIGADEQAYLDAGRILCAGCYREYARGRAAVVDAEARVPSARADVAAAAAERAQAKAARWAADAKASEPTGLESAFRFFGFVYFVLAVGCGLGAIPAMADENIPGALIIAGAGLAAVVAGMLFLALATILARLREIAANTRRDQ